MKFILKFSVVGSKHTTEFMDFDPFKLDSDSIDELVYMLTRTRNALQSIRDNRVLFEEMEKNNNVFEI